MQDLMVLSMRVCRLTNFFNLRGDYLFFEIGDYLLFETNNDITIHLLTTSFLKEY
jgi:hypothetical protein